MQHTSEWPCPLCTLLWPYVSIGCFSAPRPLFVFRDQDSKVYSLQLPFKPEPEKIAAQQAAAGAGALPPGIPPPPHFGGGPPPLPPQGPAPPPQFNPVSPRNAGLHCFVCQAVQCSCCACCTIACLALCCLAVCTADFLVYRLLCCNWQLCMRFQTKRCGQDLCTATDSVSGCPCCAMVCIAVMALCRFPGVYAFSNLYSACLMSSASFADMCFYCCRTLDCPLQHPWGRSLRPLSSCSSSKLPLTILASGLTSWKGPSHTCKELHHLQKSCNKVGKEAM